MLAITLGTDHQIRHYPAVIVDIARPRSTRCQHQKSTK